MSSRETEAAFISRTLSWLQGASSFKSSRTSHMPITPHLDQMFMIHSRYSVSSREPLVLGRTPGHPEDRRGPE